jgi:hypothetical protein
MFTEYLYSHKLLQCWTLLRSGCCTSRRGHKSRACVVADPCTNLPPRPCPPFSIPAPLQAAREQQVFAAELQEETDKLAAAYETMLQQAEKERVAMAARADDFAAQVVLHKARLERFEALAPLLRRRVTGLRIDIARVSCRLVSQLLTERKAWGRERDQLNEALAREAANGKELGAAVASAQEVILVAKQDAVDEVRVPTHSYAHAHAHAHAHDHTEVGVLYRPESAVVSTVPIEACSSVPCEGVVCRGCLGVPPLPYTARRVGFAPQRRWSPLAIVWFRCCATAQGQVRGAAPRD